jgi:hypothetical protein
VASQCSQVPDTGNDMRQRLDRTEAPHRYEGWLRGDDAGQRVSRNRAGYVVATFSGQTTGQTTGQSVSVS